MDESLLRARLTKLVEAERVLLEQINDIVEEKRRLLSGEPGIGDKLRRLEIHFDSVWCLRYTPGEVGCYVWSFGKDRAQLKRIVKILSVEEIELRMTNYIKSEEQFYARARHPFQMFVASINSHAPDMSEPKRARL